MIDIQTLLVACHETTSTSFPELTAAVPGTEPRWKENSPNRALRERPVTW